MVILLYHACLTPATPDVTVGLTMALKEFISFRLSREEHAAVKAAAKSNDMPVGVWVRAVALDAVKQKAHVEVERTVTKKHRKAA